MSEPVPVRATDAAELWRRYGADLLRLATLLVGPNEADDVVADAFLGACTAAASDDVDNPRAYLLGAVAKRAASLHRSRRRRLRRDLVAVGPATTTVADDFGDVRRAVARLTIAQRSVVYFVFWEDLTERQIADLLDLAPSTVHRTLVRAKLLLRKALQ